MLTPYRSAAFAAVLSAAALFAAPLAQAAYPDGQPVTLVCATSPGSGAAVWCQMMGTELQKPEALGVPVTVVFKPGGSNNEAALYTYSRPADGHTLLHMNASFSGYFNLPHFTHRFDKFKIATSVEKHLYVIAARCDDPEIKSWKDVVEISKKTPGAIAMGSNKLGSTHHRNHVRIAKAAGIDLRFIPYKGTGQVVKDVLGGHLRLGMAQPGNWEQHVKAGTICPLFIQDEQRLDMPVWKDVPTAKEVGLNYDIAHQWQGLGVRRDTPDEIVKAIDDAAEKVTKSPAYAEYLKTNPHVIAAFQRNSDKLTKDFEADIADAKVFMMDNGLIPKQ